MLPGDNRAATFYVLDFDRCLGDTEALHDVLVEAVTSLTPITQGMLDAARQATEASGGSFDTEKYVSGQLKASGGDVSWRHIREDFLRRAQARDMLLSHAGELLEELRARGEAFGILTHGGQEWQRAKLIGSRLGWVPALVTNTPRKGEVLRSWQQPDRRFLLPRELSPRPLIASELVLIDDKLISFADIPSGVRGYHVAWPGVKSLASQAGALPPSVTTVQGMGGIIQLLFGKTSVNTIDKA